MFMLRIKLDRKLVLHHQDALMSSTHVSRTGDPDHTDVKQWTRVIRYGNIQAEGYIVHAFMDNSFYKNELEYCNVH